MSLPDGPPVPTPPEHTPTPTKKVGAVLLPLILACVLIGFTAGYLITPTDNATPLRVLHDRALAGCIPVQYSIKDDLTPAAARELSDSQIQGARALGYTNAGYLVSEVEGGVVITMYAENCKGT